MSIEILEQVGTSPFHVTGIAFVVEERGEGARLLLRYPVKEEGLSSEDADANLFFTLPPRVMTKLFRPKKPLCGQPVTISVGGAVFCCRAILLEEKVSGDGPEEEPSLVLFSVVVALTPSIPTSIIPISGWFDNEQTPNVARNSRVQSKPEIDKKPALARASKSFLAIRRVHVSLARLCKVLEREERRCRYISNQAAQMLQINHNFHSRKERIRQGIITNSTTTTPSETNKGRMHRRTITPVSVSATTTFTETLDIAKTMQEPDVSVIVRQEQDQEIFEIMLSAPTNGINIHGNLARELVHVYHALSRNDNDFPPTPSSLLSGRDGTVYINQHVAVPIEAGSGNSFLETLPIVRPYHTLLFPHSSASELVASFSSSAARLQQLVVMTNPIKSLSDIAADAALSLHAVMELASFLIGHKACIASHVMNKATVLACSDNAILRMQQLALEFSEQFYHLSIFIVVSVLTSKGFSLGELFRRITSGETEESELLRSVLPAVFVRGRSSPKTGILPVVEKIDAQKSEGDVLVEEADNTHIEEMLFAMAVWLRAKEVVVSVEEYFVACRVGSLPVLQTRGNSTMKAAQDSDGATLHQLDVEQHPDEKLFLELLKGNYLNGNVSTVAMCWKEGLDMRRLHRFRAWGVKTGNIVPMLRVPCPGDDWGRNQQTDPCNLAR